MYEKRLTQRLTTYWEKLKKEDDMPAFGRFNSGALSDVWEYCMLLAVNDNSNSPSYSFYQMGDKVRELYGSQANSQALAPAGKSGQAANIIKRANEIIQTQGPVYDDGQFVSERNKMVKFRSCMLPFGSAGNVTHIIVGLSWREFG